VSYDVILPAALHGTGEVVATNWGWLQNWMGYWARSGGYAPNSTEETYQITTSFQNGVWNDLYNNAYDYQVMQNKASVADARYYEGIARIMKAHNFQIMVDVYNNVPYSEALKGSANVTPEYDKGIDIYKDLLKEIDAGVVLIKEATESQSRNIEDNDIVFGGDKTMWARFGNTLKLRILVHLMNGLQTPSTVTGIDIAAEIAKINTEGSGYLQAGEDAEVQPGYRDDKPNPFFATYNTDASGATPTGFNYYRANAWSIGYYHGNADPREDDFYRAGNQGLRGVPYGLPPVTENVTANLASIGPGLARGADQAQWILTATESLFLQAEAQQRGIIAGNAKATLEAAITESFAWLHIADPATATQDYLAYNAGYPDVDYDAPSIVAGQPGGGLYTILSQKWFALNGIATYEIWTDFRRTDIVYGAAVGYAPGPPISVAPNNTAIRIPTRLLFPQTEYNYNAANVGKEGNVDRYGKIFWDLN
jgi:hypothetical protein